jgi:hypothetical protein
MKPWARHDGEVRSVPAPKWENYFKIIDNYCNTSF